MTTLSDVEWAYAAGWFEARGYIRIGCQKGRTPRLTVYVQMPPKRASWFQEMFPGSAIYQLRSHVVPNGHTVKYTEVGNFRWAVSRLLARDFLVGIRPYLRHRCDFVDKSLEFLDRVVVKDEKYSLILASLVDEIRAVGKLNE